MKMYLKKKGFTLIELLVVISIISLLSSVVLNTLNSVRSKAQDTKRIQDLKQLEIALRMYYDENGSYPESSDALCPGTPAWWVGCNPKHIIHSNDDLWQPSLGGALVQYFAGGIPKDPINQWPYVYMYVYDEDGYYGAGCDDKFFVMVYLENGALANTSDCFPNPSDRYSIILDEKDW